MKLRFTIAAAAMVCFAVAGWCDTTVKATIGDQAVTGELKQITFDGDKVVLHLADNTTQDVENMNDLKITLEHNQIGAGVTSVEAVEAVNGVYNFQGIRVADTLEGLPAGFYIVNGKKVVVR